MLDEHVAEARRRLTALRGVVGVGYGYRERAGVLTQELCLRVYVREKKPKEALAPAELVPATVLGLPTDVLVVRQSRALSCELLESQTPLVGGLGISTLRGSTTVEMGTLGFFARSQHRPPPNNVVAITANHVLDGAAVGDLMYQPTLHRGSNGFLPVDRQNAHPFGVIESVGARTNRPFAWDGETAEDVWVDCAAILVETASCDGCSTNFGVEWSNAVIDSPLAGVERVRAADLPSGGAYRVWKVGRTTGRTEGRIVDVAASVEDPDTGQIAHNVIAIENTGPNCGGGTRFADYGDSGAAVVNERGHVVGLLYAGTMMLGTGDACHVHAVLAAVGAKSMGKDESKPAKQVARGEGVARAANLRLEVKTAPVWSGLIERHHVEVIRLVNTNPKVRLTWRRAGGPALLADLLLRARDTRHTSTAANHDEAVARLLRSLRRNGSAALRADIRIWGPELRKLLTAWT